jgi:peroxiredoxin Q/BCP
MLSAAGNSRFSQFFQEDPMITPVKSMKLFKTRMLLPVVACVLTSGVALNGQESVAQKLTGAVQAHKMVTVGEKAPDFTLSDENGKPVKLNSFKGKKLVVFFYDSDSAPATPDEHKRIKNVYKKYKLTDVDVLCIGPDPVASHKAMNTQLELNYHLLADKDDKIRSLYGLPPAVSGSRGRYGMVIDKEGTIRKIAGGKDLSDSVVSDMFDYAMSTTGSGF